MVDANRETGGRQKDTAMRWRGQIVALPVEVLPNARPRETSDMNNPGFWMFPAWTVYVRCRCLRWRPVELRLDRGCGLFVARLCRGLDVMRTVRGHE